MTQIATALFLSTANYSVINYLADPIRQKFPMLDLWWMVYVSFVTGFALSMIAGINLFGDYIANDMAAMIITGLVVGGGSNLIYQVFGKPS